MALFSELSVVHQQFLDLKSDLSWPPIHKITDEISKDDIPTRVRKTQQQNTKHHYSTTTT